MAALDKKVLKALEKGDALSLSKLVSSGLSVQGVDKKGNNALHLAAATNSIEICVLLVAQGIDVRQRNKKGETAAAIADSKKKTKIFAYLKEEEVKAASGGASSSPSAAKAAAVEEPVAVASSAPDDNFGPPRSAQALVNVLTYNLDAGAWEAIAEDAILSLHFTARPYQFALSASDENGKVGKVLLLEARLLIWGLPR